MPVDDDPMYPNWKAALDRLTETKAAVQRGEASNADLLAAQAEYDNICGEIDEIEGVRDLRIKIIHLDASRWRSSDDFYSALLPELGAPSWHGYNLDALQDGLSGGINRVSLPYMVRIEGTGELDPEMRTFLAKVADVFAYARKEFGADVSLTVG